MKLLDLHTSFGCKHALILQIWLYNTFLKGKVHLRFITYAYYSYTDKNQGCTIANSTWGERSIRTFLKIMCNSRFDICGICLTQRYRTSVCWRRSALYTGIHDQSCVLRTKLRSQLTPFWSCARNIYRLMFPNIFSLLRLIFTEVTSLAFLLC